MQPAPPLRLRSQAGVTEPAATPAEPGTFGPDSSADDFFLPDFCAAKTVLAVVLISEILALTFALAKAPAPDFLTQLARVSLFVQWLGLTSAALLCYTRPWLKAMSVPTASLTVFALLAANATLLSSVAAALGRYWAERGLDNLLFPQELWPFVLRNALISLIVVALLLRYFFVSHQWRHHVRAEARSRIHALQARIRPHFLFNSMNTIASLTRSDPARAESAVEDLADLFRATLKDSDAPLTLAEELELTRIYERIESSRLPDRLRVDWRIDALPMDALVPALIVQPLLENAINHGIEGLDGGGVIDVIGRRDGGFIELSVVNPVARVAERPQRPGNRVALDNIRERLKLYYGGRASLELDARGGRFEATLRFPYQK